MNSRTYVLGGIFGVLALCYVWFVLWPSGRDLQVQPVERPGQVLSFIFTDDVLIDQVTVLRYEPGPAGQEDAGYERVVWQLEADPEKADERVAEDSLRYGRQLRGMRVPEGASARPEALQRGARYRFELRTAAGEEVELDFEPRFGRG